MIKSHRILAQIGVLILIVAMVVVYGYAWFYFPGTENLLLETAPDRIANIDLYQIVEDENNQYQFSQISIEEGDPSYTVTFDLVFFQWGEEYLCESVEDYYFAFVATCDLDFITDTGNLKALFDFELACASNETYVKTTGVEDETEVIKLRFPLVNVSYKIASTNSLSLASADALAEARDPSNYEPLTLSGTDDQSEDVLLQTDTVEQLLSDLDSSQYVETFTTQAGTEDTRIKLLLFLKVSADEDNVSDAMPDARLFGSTTLSMTNALTVSLSLRTVPLHTVSSSG